MNWKIYKLFKYEVSVWFLALGGSMGIFRRIGLACVLAGFFLTTGPNSKLAAQSGSDQLKRAAVLPSVRASTDCITSGVSRQSGITGQSSDGAISDGIRRVIAGGGCDDAIMKMVAVYERTYGPGTGTAFFSGAYGRDLPRAVRSRLTSGTQNGVQTGREDLQAKVFGGVAQPAHQPLVARTAPTASTTMQPKSQAEIESEQAFRVLMSNITGIFALAVLSTLFLFFIGLGSRWVVFTHPGDLGRTSCIVIAPVATVIALALEIWRQSISDGSVNHAPLYDVVTGHWTTMAILVVGALVFVWSVFWTFFSSIMCNGWIVGIVFAILKVTAILLLCLSLIGTIYLGDGKSEHRQRQPNLLMWFVFGAIIWFASKLINGHRVAERRERLEAQTFHEIEAA